MTESRRAPVMVPVLVSCDGVAEVMVDERDVDSLQAVRTALIYAMPEGFYLEVEDWEALPR